MTIRMDKNTEAMVVFFDYLCRRLNSRFAKLNKAKMAGLIVEQMKEYGLAKRSKDLTHRWIATRKLIREIKKSPKERTYRHPDYLDLIDKGAHRPCEKHGNVCPTDKWRFFELRFRVIFEYQHKHCMRWMNDYFSPKGSPAAKVALFIVAINTCIADMNNVSSTHKKYAYEHDHDDEDCLPPARDASSGMVTLPAQEQPIMKNNIIAFPTKHTPHP
jgi:hypothetical protein